MQDFIYKPTDNGTYAVVGYQGDERDVKIPDSYGGGVISVIGDKLFSGHSEIESVSIPDTVTDMGEFVFDGCVKLRHIDLPENLECLWGYCKNLKKVVCGKGLKKIYSWVFSGCDSFEELVKNEIVKVSEKAFDTKELNT